MSDVPRDPANHTPVRPVGAQYVNYLQIGRNAHEIVLEFGQYHEGDPEPHIQVRLVTHEAYACEFVHVLAEALK